MTNPDTNMDEKAKDICRWMQKQVEHDEFNDWWLWEISEGKWTDPDRVKIREEKAHCGYKDIKVPISDLYNSLDVIREVEESIRDTEFWVTYIDVLSRDLPYDRGKPIGLFEIATADPKTRLLAIHKTLREVEEIDNDPEN